jgi:protein TonB
MKFIFILIICNTCFCFGQDGDSTITKAPLIELEEKGLERVKTIKQPKSQEDFIKVDVFPEPIGGIEGIQNKMEYPVKAIEQEIEGKVYVLAFVNESGDVDDAQVILGIGGGCDEEALRAVKETKFTPGMHNGKYVKVQVAIPIVFKLNQEK